MSIQQHYNQWSDTYDEVENKTRDLEKRAGQTVLARLSFASVLELGCGTGKNTGWLSERAKQHFAVDLSEGMLEKAREKVMSQHVQFQQADITKPWNFIAADVDLITCSLILEHIEDLRFVFYEAAKVLKTGGHFYICELHPYKQYTGSKARFETENGTQVLECFVHHVSDYTNAALENGFAIDVVEEWFDEDDRSNPPRLLSFLFRKK
ncbi:MAG TPA: class I SAM-dependent methyltransferase [Flavisolibacter sp.]|jgi:ubiquinone/menaquinone biosynthesis C-methylase UbiE|nr:class I SAM-dependent methyltransferase [Flavisolibacter sp.]